MIHLNLITGLKETTASLKIPRGRQYTPTAIKYENFDDNILITISRVDTIVLTNFLHAISQPYEPLFATCTKHRASSPSYRGKYFSTRKKYTCILRRQAVFDLDSTGGAVRPDKGPYTLGPYIEDFHKN